MHPGVDTPIRIFDIRWSGPPIVDSFTPTVSRGVLVSTSVRSYWNPDQADEAKLISQILKSPMGSTHEIPKKIHRFWTGGPMRPGVLKDLLADGVRAKRAGWTCYLWYSAEVETILDAEVDAAIQRTKGIFILSTRPPMPKDTRPLRKQQRLQLAGAGYKIHPIEKLQPTKYVVRFAQMAGRSAVNRNWDDVKYFSDLARLRYLYYLGGIHMDVDISLGDMDLDQQYYHNDPNGNVPLMGSLLRTQDDPMVLHLRYLARLRGLSPLTKEEWDGYMLALRALVKQGMAAAGMLNALIASRPRTSHLEAALTEYKQAMEKYGGLLSGMSLARTLLFGKSRTGDLDQAMAWTVPPYLVRLNPDTEESNL